MIQKQNIEAEYLSSAQAATELGVSRHQIAMLVKAGDVAAAKLGGRLLVDPYSLRLYKQIRRGKGRPLAPDVAWAALWALSGLESPWLTYQQGRRLVERLRTVAATDLVWQVRRRARLRVFRADPSVFGELRGTLVLSGKNTDRPDIFGMPKNDAEVEGYVLEEELASLQERFGLREGISGNVLVHVFATRPWDEGAGVQHRQMPVAVVAADLASSLDMRESRAGLAALDILLGALHNR